MSSTNWAAMTAVDWVGVVLVVAIAIGMAAAYIHTLRPKNRDKFKAYGDIPFKDESESGEQHEHRE